MLVETLIVFPIIAVALIAMCAKTDSDGADKSAKKGKAEDQGMDELANISETYEFHIIPEKQKANASP